MSTLTIDQVMTNTPKVFKPEAAEGVNATVQFHFTGEQASDWVLKIAEGTCSTEPGSADEPTMTMTIDSQDYLDILSGELNAMSAFMSGKVMVKGDMALAMKFTNFFDMGKGLG